MSLMSNLAVEFAERGIDLDNPALDPRTDSIVLDQIRELLSDDGEWQDMPAMLGRISTLLEVAGRMPWDTAAEARADNDLLLARRGSHRRRLEVAADPAIDLDEPTDAELDVAIFELDAAVVPTRNLPAIQRVTAFLEAVKVVRR